MSGINHLLLCATLAVTVLPARAAEPFACAVEPGFLSGPFVATDAAAKRIYQAIAAEVAPGSLDRFPLILATDLGDHWLVTQSEPFSPQPALGGGQLHMQIDKCTGAVSGAAFSR